MVDRLFWGLLLKYWASLIAACCVAAVPWVLLSWLGPSSIPRAEQVRAEMMVSTLGNLANKGQRSAMEKLLEGWHESGTRPEVYVVDDEGHELLGRQVPTSALSEARKQEKKSGSQGLVRRIASMKSPSITVFAPMADLQPEVAQASQGRPSPVIHISVLAVVIISLVCSALLARTVSLPIRRLRWAFREVVKGRMNTRIQAQVKYRDEISDLCLGFDGMAKQIESLVGMHRTLLHDVSHEIRSPLSRVQAAIGLARQQPERIEEMLGRVQEEFGQLQSLMQGLQAFLRTESSAGDGVAERLDIVQMVVDAASRVQSVAHSPAKDLAITAIGEFIAEVHVVPIRDALEGIIQGALACTEEGASVEIEVLAGAQRIVISIRDRGTGLQMPQLQDLFEPFQRTGRPGRDPTGLGLATAKRAVTSHGGTLIPSLRVGGGLSIQMSFTRAGIFESRARRT